jgi:hypothetical protein
LQHDLPAQNFIMGGIIRSYGKALLDVPLLKFTEYDTPSAFSIVMEITGIHVLEFKDCMEIKPGIEFHHCVHI